MIDIDNIEDLSSLWEIIHAHLDGHLQGTLITEDDEDFVQACQAVTIVALAIKGVDAETAFDMVVPEDRDVKLIVAREKDGTVQITFDLDTGTETVVSP